MVRGIQATPFLFRSPVTGSVADRYPWKFLVVGAVRQWLHSHGHRRVILFGLIRSSHVYVTALLMACVQVLLQPARAAIISDTYRRKPRPMP
jgi:hypothetical protein